MRPNRFRLLLAAALLAGAATAASAKPRRIVVLDFDGQRLFADAGRNTIMSVLGDQYDVVATRRWEAARAQATGHGPQQWQQAAKQAGVDAVVEGYVQDEGRHHVLTVVVREAATGREMDSLSIRIGAKGLDTDQSKKLSNQLNEIFDWIDTDITADPESRLPDVRAQRPMLGAHHEEPTKDTKDDEDDHQETKAPEKPVEIPAPKKVVAQLPEPSQDTNDLVKLFGPESKEADIITDHKIKHVPQPTPRFEIAAGGYYASRGMSFDGDTVPEYPASGIKGLRLEGAFYPAPSQKMDGDLQGVGFSFKLAHSLGSVLTSQDTDGTIYDSTIDNTARELGVHYRWPIGIVAIDTGVALGNETHAIVDLPASVEIPDTSVTYLSAGGHLDLYVTDKATIGFGAHYLYVSSGGDINNEDMYGAGDAWGLTLDADFQIPLSGPVFIKGGLEYRRVSYDFEGSGQEAMDLNMSSIVDTSIAGLALVGVKF
jgi:hypothetical protein